MSAAQADRSAQRHEMPASMPTRKLLSLRYTHRLLTISSIPRPLFWNAMSPTPPSLGLTQICAAGVAAVGCRFAWRCPVESDVTLEHRQQAFTVDRIAGFDDEIE